jgi:hypothetical protein
MRHEYRAAGYGEFGPPRETLARARRDAERMLVSSTQRELRMQVRLVDPETDAAGEWSFLDEDRSS